VAGVPSIHVTHLTTGRTMVGTPDELLDWLPNWWPEAESDDGAVYSQITQAVYEWESGQFDGWRTRSLGLQATPLA